jgi:putative NAD(P)-binding protein
MVTAWSPSAASPMTGRPLSSSRPRSAARMAGASSAISTRGGRAGSAAGPRHVAEVSRVIALAMADLGVRRLVVTSPYGMVAKQPRLIAPLLRRLLAAPFADAAAMEQLIFASDLDWTVVRLPQLTDQPARGRFRTSRELFTKGPYPIARADAAAALLDIAEDSTNDQPSACDQRNHALAGPQNQQHRRQNNQAGILR